MHGITDEQNYKNIADAIREKNGSSDTYTPSEMAEAIKNIQSSGGEGFDFSGIYDVNLGTEINDIFKDGIEYAKEIYNTYNDSNTSGWTSKFWGDLRLQFIPNLNLPNNNDFSSTFRETGAMFCGALYAPKVASCNNIFLNSRHLKRIEKLDIPNASQIYMGFNACTLLEYLEIPNAEKITNFDSAFGGCGRLTTLRINKWKRGNIVPTSSAVLHPSSIRYIIWHALNGDNTLGFENEGATSRTLQLHATPYAYWEEWKTTKPSVEDCEYLGVDETEITKYGELTWEDIALNVKLITIAK